MMNYKDWETLNESIGTGYTLGLTNPTTLGLVGDHYQEAKPPFLDDDEDEDDDDYDGDLADEDEEEDGLEGDIMGGEEEDGIMGSEEGPESSFPPDGDMDDADDEDDEMAGVLGDIDPDLAGLGDDDELGPELTGDMGDEMGDMEMGDELGDEMGDMDMGDEMGDMEMGDELGDEMGDMDMGDEMGDMDMGDEMGDMDMGDEMGMEMPCPTCNMDGEMEEGEPDCEECGGEGFIADEEGGDLDVDMEDDMGGMGDEADVEGEGLAVSDLMHRMQDYMQRYMAPKMAAHMDSGSEYMAADDNLAAKHKADAGSGEVRRPTHAIKAKARSFMSKDAHDKSMKNMKNMDADLKKNMKHMCGGGTCENFVGSQTETHDDFLANLMRSTVEGLPQGGKSGLSEDALFQVVDQDDGFPQAVKPEVGEVGFAPQGRVGGIGGGYTQDDISDIPTLGEGRKYITLDQYIAKKSS